VNFSEPRMELILVGLWARQIFDAIRPMRMFAPIRMR